MSDAGYIYEHFRSKLPKPEEGDLEIWWFPQVGGKSFHWSVPDLVTASVMLDALASYDSFQFAEGVKGDYCNAGGLNVFRDGEWEDWYDEETGDDFDAYRERFYDKWN